MRNIGGSPACADVVALLHQDVPTPRAASGPAPRWRPNPPRDAAGGLAAAGVVITNVVILAQLQVPVLSATIGFWFLIVYPVFLLAGASIWGGVGRLERVGYSVAGVLMALILGGLALNALLPLIGISRPLHPVPVTVLGDGLILALVALRRRYPADLSGGRRALRLRAAEARLLPGAGLCVVGAVLGANRLNNGAGGQVAWLALAGVVAAFGFLLLRRGELREEAIGAALYLLSLALLLMTSLRGWSVTGHDIQREYRVFQLTMASGHWDIAAFPDPYNACLSITILPAELATALQQNGPYIYKLFFQLIFAICPVMVYCLARRYWSVGIGVLAVVYFVGFPTFVNDMPFLNRQAMAFVFVAVAAAAALERSWPRRTRRVVFLGAAIGVELAHYSSMYVLLGTILLGWLALRGRALASVLGRRRRESRDSRDSRESRESRESSRDDGQGGAIGATTLVLLTAVTLLWGGLATHTAGGALDVAKSTVTALVGGSGGARSGAVSYSLLSQLRGPSQSPQEVLDDYQKQALADRAAADPQQYLPLSGVRRYPPTAVDAPLLPLTGLGRAAQAVGISVPGLNQAVRRLAAGAEQAFLGVGLLVILLAGRRPRRLGGEFFILATGSVAMVATITVLPNLTADYGVLRAFQEALIVVSPVLVAGSMTVLGWMRKGWRRRGAAAVCLGLFCSTSGLLPQALGGYPAQLSLADAGTYYDVYYTHPQELAALAWARQQEGVLPVGLQASFDPQRFVYMSPSQVDGSQFVLGDYPATLARDSWVLIGYSTIHTGRSSVFFRGDVLTYRYPMDLLNDNKNLVFNNGDTEIYK